MDDLTTTSDVPATTQKTSEADVDYMLIFAYVAFGIGTGLVIIAIIRLIWWLCIGRKKPKGNNNFYGSNILSRSRASYISGRKSNLQEDVLRGVNVNDFYSYPVDGMSDSHGNEQPGAGQIDNVLYSETHLDQQQPVTDIEALYSVPYKKFRGSPSITSSNQGQSPMQGASALPSEGLVVSGTDQQTSQTSVISSSSRSQCNSPAGPESGVRESTSSMNTSLSASRLEPGIHVPVHASWTRVSQPTSLEQINSIDIDGAYADVSNEIPTIPVSPTYIYEDQTLPNSSEVLYNVIVTVR